MSLSPVLSASGSEWQSTCLHSELPWAHSSWAPVWRCCRVAARYPLRTTSECTRLAFEGVPGDHHLYTQHSTCYNPPETTLKALQQREWGKKCILHFLCPIHYFPALNYKSEIFSTTGASCIQYCLQSTHHSWGCTGCLRWERSASWKGLRSRPCLVWRAAACRGADHLPSTPPHPDSHLNNTQYKTKISCCTAPLNDTYTSVPYHKSPSM